MSDFYRNQGSRNDKDHIKRKKVNYGRNFIKYSPYKQMAEIYAKRVITQ